MRGGRHALGDDPRSASDLRGGGPGDRGPAQRRPGDPRHPGAAAAAEAHQQREGAQPGRPGEGRGRVSSARTSASSSSATRRPSRPATPYGVQQMLIRSGIETKGAHAVIVGRSHIVGKPMANLLIQTGPGGDATVTVCHSQTRDLPAVCRSADILIAAIGKPEFVTARHGASRAPSSSTSGSTGSTMPRRRRGTGSAATSPTRECADIASAITPVPGGVGPMTIAMLLQNTLQAMRQADAVTLPLPFGAGGSRSRRGLVGERPQPGSPGLLEQNMPAGLGAGRSHQLQVVRERPLVLHAAGRRRVRCAASCGSAACGQRREEQAGGRLPRCTSSARPGSGRRRASSASPRSAAPTATSLGQQQQELERARAALLRDGLLDPSRKRPLPRFPPPSPWSPARRARRCATSSPWRGAAGRRCGSWWSGARVQGDERCPTGPGAATGQPCPARTSASSAGAGARARTSRAFNDGGGVPRARGGAGSRRSPPWGTRPTSRSADLVADVRAATPSAAAELAVPDQRECAAGGRSRRCASPAGLRRRTRLARASGWGAPATGWRRDGAGWSRSTGTGSSASAPSSTRSARCGCSSAALRCRCRRRAACSSRREDFTPGLRYRLRVSDGDVPARVEDA